MLDPSYVVGLVDGEGSFTVYVRNLKDSNERQRRVRVEPKFYIKFVEKDKDILYRLQRFFACGKIYFQKDRRKRHQQCYRYEVFNRSDLMEKIIPFFKNHRLKLASKQKDFELFCKLMDMIDRKQHLTVKGMQKIYKIKQQMH